MLILSLLKVPCIVDRRAASVAAAAELGMKEGLGTDFSNSEILVPIRIAGRCPVVR
jgi:hypothetical protein